MFREFDYIELGGTLYTPAINKSILSLASGEKFPFLKSMVFCLEDAIKDTQVNEAIDNIQSFLIDYKRTEAKVFIRPKDESNLKELLSLKDIQKIDGFALAKFSSLNMKNYFEILNSTKNKYHIMPVIESSDMFDIDKLKQIKEFLQAQSKHNILTLRIGGEDMFKSLGLKKECSDSIHDFHISSRVFADLFSVFKVNGLNITAPVYNCLENEDIFCDEVRRDIKEGFFGKTVIHPNQAKLINDIYKVNQEQLKEAIKILDSSQEAISRYKDKMLEPKAHNVWAKSILKRKDVFGVS